MCVVEGACVGRGGLCVEGPVWVVEGACVGRGGLCG